MEDLDTHCSIRLAGYGDYNCADCSRWVKVLGGPLTVTTLQDDSEIDTPKSGVFECYFHNDRVCCLLKALCQNNTQRN